MADQREAHPLRLDRVVRVGVGNRDDAEADGVVGDGQQQQKVDGGVAQREDLRETVRDGASRGGQGRDLPDDWRK